MHDLAISVSESFPAKDYLAVTIFITSLPPGLIGPSFVELRVYSKIPVFDPPFSSWTISISLSPLLTFSVRIAVTSLFAPFFRGRGR